MTKTTTASAHTPAPWMVSGTEIQSVKYGRVAHLHIAGYEEKEIVANARLIAAAPDLLEACKLLLAVIDKDVHLKAMLAQGDLGMINNALCIARPAIAKAEGQA